jgi:DNA-binding transcriptional LysR family regulator
MGELEPSHMIARPLAHLLAHLFASPRYLERNGTPRDPSQLAQHECLFMPTSAIWSLSDGEDRVDVAVSGRFRANSVGMIRRLATLDMGIALIPEEFVADEVATGQLQRLLPQWQGAPTTVYAITETRLLPAKTQRFIEFLQEQLKARRAIA